MPILAVCPYCREGRVRAPSHAVGQSATCPRCYSCFTLVDSDELKAPKAGPAAARASVPAATKPASTAITTAIDSPNAELEADELFDAAMNETPELPAPVTVLPPARPMPVDFPASSQPEFGFVLGLIAVIVAGVGLVASQVPYGRIASMAVCSVGLLLGIVSILMTERKYLVPGLATLANAVAVVLVLFLPSWLGLSTWLPQRSTENPKLITAVNYNGDVPVPTEWVDISNAAWQQDDVRVTVRASAISPLELSGPENKKKWTKEKYLQIWVQIKNSGVARPIDFRGWALVEAPNVEIPKLSDSAGKSVALKTFEGEWQPATAIDAKPLFPGKTSDQLLIFKLPEPKIDHLKLELPGAAFGGTEPVRLLIPRGSILYRS